MKELKRLAARLREALNVVGGGNANKFLKSRGWKPVEGHGFRYLSPYDKVSEAFVKRALKIERRKDTDALLKYAEKM